MSLGLFADAYARFGSSHAPHSAGTAWAAWAFVVSIEIGTAPLAFILLLFPHGRLLSRRWRAVGVAAVALPLAGAVCTAISDVNFSAATNFPTLRDPVQLVSKSAMSPVYGAAQLANLLVLLVERGISLEEISRELKGRRGGKMGSYFGTEEKL